jgi:hydrogenase maturation factor
MSSFKAYSTASLIISDTIHISDTIQVSKPVNLDSIKRLVPTGYYILTESGARQSVKAAIDAKAYEKKWQMADEALGKMTATVTWITMQHNEEKTESLKKDEIIRQMGKQLKSAVFWKYAAISLAAGLGTQLLLK